ncbi:hypothetical protein E4T45_13819 [Aureobasidium sp. EXF-8846]|nr:hypothetical protein E4T45_13819 [Aureobasidium sp. EXF-8846]
MSRTDSSCWHAAVNSNRKSQRLNSRTFSKPCPSSKRRKRLSRCQEEKEVGMMMTWRIS